MDRDFKINKLSPFKTDLLGSVFLNVEIFKFTVISDERGEKQEYHNDS